MNIANIDHPLDVALAKSDETAKVAKRLCNFTPDAGPRHPRHDIEEIFRLVADLSDASAVASNALDAYLAHRCPSGSSRDVRMRDLELSDIKSAAYERSARAERALVAAYRLPFQNNERSKPPSVQAQQLRALDTCIDMIAPSIGLSGTDAKGGQGEAHSPSTGPTYVGNSITNREVTQ